jgi:hypothetical protein
MNQRFIPLVLASVVFYSAGYARGQAKPNAAITEFEPAWAVRASACITDFGHGDRYFFGKPVSGAKFGPFDGNVYGDFYGGEPDKTGWLSAEIGKTIVVPEAAIDLDLPAAVAQLAPGYRQPLRSASLAQYLRALESQKQRPAAVVGRRLYWRRALASFPDRAFNRSSSRATAPRLKSAA